MKLLTACCFVDVLRVFAPEAPYEDAQLMVRASPCFPTFITNPMLQ